MMSDTFTGTNYSIEFPKNATVTLRELADAIFADTGIMPDVVTVNSVGDIIQKAVPADTLPEYQQPAGSDANDGQ